MGICRCVYRVEGKRNLYILLPCNDIRSDNFISGYAQRQGNDLRLYMTSTVPTWCLISNKVGSNISGELSYLDGFF